MKRLRKGQKCQYKDCEEVALWLAYSRHEKKVGAYCDFHYYQVLDEDYPEYGVDCPNCGCGFGVN